MNTVVKVRFVAALLALTLGFGVGVQAQVQRSFGNTGFDQIAPGLTTACYSELLAVDVPFWQTTHPSSTGAQDTCQYPGVSPNTGTYTGSQIELHANGFKSVYATTAATSIWARDGLAFAELSAKVDSSLYQQVCLVRGEEINWQLSHLGLTGTEEMRFVISSTLAGISSPAALAATAASGGIVQARTTNAGVGTIASCQGGSNVIDTTPCTVTAGTSPNGITRWADYRGSFTWRGTAGVNYMAFGAITPAGSDRGNLIDRVIVTLKAYIEFASTNTTGAESVVIPTGLGLRVAGNVTTALTVPITVTGGTATLGTDYTTPSGTATFNITIPVGNYTGSTLIPTGITIINDGVAETNETITLQIETSASYVIASTASCGATANNIATYTIIDDDRPKISINKTRLGGTGTVDFGFSGSNGVPTTVTNISTTADNVSTTVAALTNLPIMTDGVAITFTETQPSTQWRLTAVSCIDANAGNAQLGNTNPGTNLATFSGNAVTIAAANVLHTSAFNCSVTNTRFSDITLRKLWIDAVPNNAATVSATGLTSLLSVANTANETDTGTLQSVAFGSVLTLAEVITTGVSSNYAATLACTGTTGLVGNTLTVGAADTAIVCTYTNKSIAVALTISKTDSKTFATSGGTNDYVISLSNAGPGAADGVVVTDVVGTGLTCPPANLVACTVINMGGPLDAQCPTGLTLGNLISPGYTIASFPANSGLQFSYTCHVN